MSTRKTTPARPPTPFGGTALHRQVALVALGVAALGATLLVAYLQRFEAEKSGGPPVAVLVVTKGLPPGSTLVDGVLAEREIPMAYVDGRMVKRGEREKVVGLRTSATLEAQDTLSWNDLAVFAEERRDLSSLVTPGFRAVYIRAMREDQGSPLINPGDYVDVIATLPPPAGEGKPEGNTAVVLLQRVLVLASGGKTSPEGASSAQALREQGLTLSLNLHDSQVIALASERGRFSVALRNPDDPRTVDDVPELGEAALLRPAQVARHATGPVRLKDTLVGGFVR